MPHKVLFYMVLKTLLWKRERYERRGDYILSVITSYHTTTSIKKDRKHTLVYFSFFLALDMKALIKREQWVNN